MAAKAGNWQILDTRTKGQEYPQPLSIKVEMSSGHAVQVDVEWDFRWQYVATASKMAVPEGGYVKTEDWPIIDAAVQEALDQVIKDGPQAP